MDGSQSPSIHRQADGCQGTGLSIWAQPRAPLQGQWCRFRPNTQTGKTGQTGDHVTSSLLGSCCSLLLRWSEMLARDWGLQGGTLLEITGGYYLTNLLCCLHASKLDQKVAQKKGGRRKGTSPSPFLDCGHHCNSKSQKRVFSSLTTTVVNYWGINNGKRYVLPEVTID